MPNLVVPFHPSDQEGHPVLQDLDILVHPSVLVDLHQVHPSGRQDQCLQVFLACQDFLDHLCHPLLQQNPGNQAVPVILEVLAFQLHLANPPRRAIPCLLVDQVVQAEKWQQLPLL